MTLAVAILGLVLAVSIWINIALLNRLLVQANIPTLKPVPVIRHEPQEEEKPKKKPLFTVPIPD